MSKRESISRYNLIIKKLRKYPVSFDEIADYLALESELQEYDFNISKRTFQRDLNDIRSIYNIDIQYDYADKVYFIDYAEQHDVSQRILEAFDVFNALSISDRLSDFIHFEKRRPQGTENLYGLLHAIKNKFLVRFTHQKYWDTEITQRNVEPYALKEFKYRWYVIGKDLGDKQVKSFALDRFDDLEITKTVFQYPDDFDINEYFKDCFGIINPKDDKPMEIILSFQPLQGKYVKSLPLHESQEILLDNEKELQIRLRLFITHDFIMELLSMGDTVKVLKPGVLVNKLIKTYQNMLNLYD